MRFSCAGVNPLWPALPSSTSPRRPRSAIRAVRLQLRLPCAAAPAGRPGPAVVEPRVHQLRDHVPGLEPRRTHAGSRGHRARRARRITRGRGPAHRGREWPARGGRTPAEPAGHRRDTDGADRPRGRSRPAQNVRGPDRHPRARDAEQLRRRQHPVGHGADLRGELRPVLRQRAGVSPIPPRAPCTTAIDFDEGPSQRKWELHHPRFDLAREPHEPFRFGWVVEIDPTDPTSVPREAHRDGPVQARRRHPAHRQRRPRRVLHGRRHPLRVRLQVRHRRPLLPRRPQRRT